MENFLTPTQVQLLETAHRSTKDKRQADRIKTILAINEGFDYQEIVRILRLDDSTVRKYVADFETEGIVVRDRYIGKHGKLTKAEEEELTTHIKATIYTCADEVVTYVGKIYQVMYSRRGMEKLLRRLHFVFKKTQIIPGKADKAKQGTFIAKYEELKANLKPGDRIYFVDAAHPHHNTRPGYAWIYVGEDKEVRSNTGRERVNLNGAIALPTEYCDAFELVFSEEPVINDEAMIRLIEDLKERQGRGKIHIIEDNARYNHSYLMQAYLEQNKPRVEVHYIPAYSPNLNLIERLWKFYYEKVVQHEYYEDLQTFRGATHTFFESVTATFDKELRTRLTDNFQLIGR